MFRLAPELRNGIILDALQWFERCNGAPGRAIDPKTETIFEASLPWKWRELAGSVRAASYRTPYENLGDYMERFWYLPEIYGERARVHRTRRSDRGRDRHDHPWHYVSIVLEGGYTEEIEAHGQLERRRYRQGDVLFRHAEHRHRLELDDFSECWTLVFTSPNVRDWGFWTPEGFVPWHEYADAEPA